MEHAVMGRTHALTGAALWLAVTPLTPFTGPEVAIGTAVAAAGALLPDLDHPQAKATRILGPLRYPVAGLISRVAGGRRAGTHYLATALAVGAILWLWTPWVGAAIALGMIAHSLGDMATVGGVKWLWPLPWRISGPLKTGGRIELMAVAPALTLTCAWLTWQQLQAPAGEVMAAAREWRPW
jgi:membrane-bound metal-dependent hydrolase YbcI (DUF457 family)